MKNFINHTICHMCYCIIACIRCVNYSRNHIRFSMVLWAVWNFYFLRLSFIPNSIRYPRDLQYYRYLLKK